MDDLSSKIEIKHLYDKASRLAILENLESSNFIPRRIFFIRNSIANDLRGGHAHQTCVQILLVLNGEIEIKLDNGRNQNSIVLNSHSDAILIKPMIWAEQRYIQTDSILCVIASEGYDEKEYIRNYAEFSNMCAKD